MLAYGIYVRVVDISDSKNEYILIDRIGIPNFTTSLSNYSYINPSVYTPILNNIPCSSRQRHDYMRASVPVPWLFKIASKANPRLSTADGPRSLILASNIVDTPA